MPRLFLILAQFVYGISVPLSEAAAHVPGRREYVRAVTRRRGGLDVTVAGKRGLGMLRSAMASKSLLVVPVDSPHPPSFSERGRNCAAEL